MRADGEDRAREVTADLRARVALDLPTPARVIAAAAIEGRHAIPRSSPATAGGP